MSNFSILDFIHNLIYKICKIISVRVRDLITIYSLQDEEIAELKQALHEIKEIAETLKTDICSYCDSKNTDRCDQTDIDEIAQIIQKCEVLDD